MDKISAAKPGVSGGVWCAPAGSTLPTDARSALDSAFASLGHVSDAGLTRNLNKEAAPINAWGGQVVAIVGGKKTETFKYKLLTYNNPTILEMVFGEAAGDLTNGIAVKSNGSQGVAHAYVFEAILGDDVHQRIVVPSAIVTEVRDIVYVDSDVIAFDLTITAIADSYGNTAYEYLQTITGATGATGATN